MVRQHWLPGHWGIDSCVPSEWFLFTGSGAVITIDSVIKGSLLLMKIAWILNGYFICLNQRYSSHNSYYSPAVLLLTTGGSKAFYSKYISGNIMETVQKTFSSFDLVQIFYFCISLSALWLLESSTMQQTEASFILSLIVHFFSPLNLGFPWKTTMATAWHGGSHSRQQCCTGPMLLTGRNGISCSPGIDNIFRGSPC